jgi:hypothetical protein
MGAEFLKKYDDAEAEDPSLVALSLTVPMLKSAGVPVQHIELICRLLISARLSRASSYRIP